MGKRIKGKFRAMMLNRDSPEIGRGRVNLLDGSPDIFHILVKWRTRRNERRPLYCHEAMIEYTIKNLNKHRENEKTKNYLSGEFWYPKNRLRSLKNLEADAVADFCRNANANDFIAGSRIITSFLNYGCDADRELLKLKVNKYMKADPEFRNEMMQSWFLSLFGKSFSMGDSNSENKSMIALLEVELKSMKERQRIKDEECNMKEEAES